MAIDWNKIDLELIVTYKCNLRCSHCCLSCTEVGADIGKEEAKNAISQLSNMGVRQVHFFGGEPTLRMKFLCELIQFARSLGMHTAIFTNAWWGLRNHREYSLALSKAGLHDCYISIDRYHLEQLSFQNIKIATAALYCHDIKVAYQWNSKYFSQGANEQTLKKAVEEIMPYVSLNDIADYYLGKYTVSKANIESAGRSVSLQESTIKSLRAINKWNDSIRVSINPGNTFHLNCPLKKDFALYEYHPAYLAKTVEYLVNKKIEDRNAGKLYTGYCSSCVHCSVIKSNERLAEGWNSYQEEILKRYSNEKTGGQLGASAGMVEPVILAPGKFYARH